MDIRKVNCVALRTFRGYSKESNEWLYGYLSNKNGMEYIGFKNSSGNWDEIEVVHGSVGICLSDNGLFEDDILKMTVSHHDIKDTVDYAEVIYESWRGELLLCSEDESYCIDDGYSEYEIIGNRFENPNLYEDKIAEMDNV